METRSIGYRKTFLFKNAKTITQVSEARGVIILAALKAVLKLENLHPAS